MIDWTVWEDEQLRRIYSIPAKQEFCAALAEFRAKKGVGQMVVTRRADKLELVDLRRRMLGGEWSEQDDTELRRIYAMSESGRAAAAIARLAKIKGATPRACRQRAYSLGIGRVSNRYRRWTQTEDENLTAYAGRLSVRKIARILARTDDAVKDRISILQLSAKVQKRGYTRQELADRLGVDPDDTLRDLLKRFPIPKNLLGNFDEDEVQMWLWEHLEDLELRKMHQPWLKSMLRSAA